MRVRTLLSALGYLALISAPLQAQVQVSAQTERTNYLLYERVDLLVTVQNMGDTALVLDNNEGHPWLSFLVSKHNRLPVHQERASQFAPLDLKVGETKTLRINLTPLFAFREEGDYRAEAVVDLPGQGPVISEGVPFVVLKGRSVWSQARPVDSAQRIYSLVRFSPDANTTRLYLRVENPGENIVYANLSLGDLASYSDPEVFFDPKGNLHILQPIALSTYLYTRADPDGKVLDQTVFKTFHEIRPRLRKVEDGNVVVMGGQAEDANSPREKLADTQKHASPEQPPVVQPVGGP
jgi:hypothetical protein